MISERFVTLLRCPETRLPLSNANAELVERINTAIAARRLKNVAGQVLELPVQGALVRDDNRRAYLVIDDIPLLLIDEGIELAEIP